MSKHTIAAKKRDLSENLNQMRLNNVLPGNLFEAHKPSRAISLDLFEFIKLFDEIGESNVAYLKVNGKGEVPVMIEEVQTNPVTDLPIHATFQVVDLTEKVLAEIPVEIEGEFELPEAVLVTVRDEIEVRALPTDLPEKFVVNVEELSEIGQAITLADLDYDSSKIEIVVGDEGLEAPVVLVQEVEEEPEEPEEPIETEVIGEEEVGEESVEDEGAPEVEGVEQETKDKPVLEKSGEGQS
jgi:large subunit ribosomal protein L25